MQVALDHLKEMPNAPLYSQVFFADNVRFQYPPSALFGLSAMLAVAPERVQIDEVYDGPWPALNSLLGWVCVALTAISAAALLEIGLASARPHIDWRRMRGLRALVVGGLTLTFYPVAKAFTLGQIQVWVNALFALGMLAWAGKYKIASGILMGLIGLIKPHYGLFLVWAAVRREKRFAAACTTTIGTGAAASIAIYGLANHIDYLRVLSFLSQHGEAYYANQSVNGVLNRLMSIAAPDAFVTLDLPSGRFPPFTPWIWAATLASSLGSCCSRCCGRAVEAPMGTCSIFRSWRSPAPWRLPSPGSTTMAWPCPSMPPCWRAHLAAANGGCGLPSPTCS